MRTLPAGLQTELAKRGRSIHRVHLFDIQRSGGSQYFWSDVEGVFTSRLTGAAQQYKPWIVQPPTITLSRSLTTDGGNFQLQNLSGNTIDREVQALLTAGEFEGAYAIYRPWFVPLDVAGWEFHGFLSEQHPGQDNVQFRVLQLFQPNTIPAYDFVQTIDCHFRYRSAQCGMRMGTVFAGPALADTHTSTTIGFSGLALMPNLYANEMVMIIGGTGAPEQGYILSHNASVFTMKSAWGVTPDATSKFIVTGPGTNKILSGSGNAFFATIFSANTIGAASLTRTVNGDTDGRVIIVAGTGAGQERAIVSNTATTFTVSPNWTTIPDNTSQFLVIYQLCPKDLASCTTRGVTERFPGIIHLQPQITANIGPSGAGVGGVSPSRGAGGTHSGRNPL